MNTRIVFLYIVLAFPLVLCAMEDTKIPAIPTEYRPYFVMYTDENAPQPNNGIPLDPSQLLDPKTHEAFQGMRGIKQQTPQRSWRTFAKNNWRKIVGTTALAGYVAYYAKYNPEALTEVYTWAQNSWQALPQFFKPLAKMAIAGIALNKTYTYFFKKPLMENPNNEKYVTYEALEKCCGEILRNAKSVINNQNLMMNLSLKIMQQDPHIKEMMQRMATPTDNQQVPLSEPVD